MDKITKAVIPCGGMGTRFLPITKSVAKEILPVIDTPVLGHIVKEAIDSGITDILIVLGAGKGVIKDYFTKNPDYEKKLRDSGKSEYADVVASIGAGANITFVTQEKPLGSGDALLYAEKFTGKEPFVLAWGDDLINAEKPVMAQLMEVYDKHKNAVLGVQTINSDDVTKYGVCDIKNEKSIDGDRTYNCYNIVEKPPLTALPSRLCALGRYILTNEIYDIIRKTPTGVGGELQLTDSLNRLAQMGKVNAFDFVGKRYDMGDKFGSVCASLDYGIKDPSYGERLKQYIKEFAKTL